MAIHADEAALTDAFLRNAAEPVREHLGASVELRDFIRDAGALSLDERRLLVDQALVLLEQNYVHLPLKIAMHGINPLQRLRLLRVRLERQSAADLEREWRFHAELSEIFHSLRDLHTNYLLPEPFSSKIAYLPFQIEEFFEDGDPHYVVSRLVEGYSPPEFEPGVEVTYWNGVPIARAVDLNAARFAGSNAAARHVRGLESLTIRPLRVHLPPDEEVVTVEFVGKNGRPGELRQAWLVVDNLPRFVADTDGLEEAASLGVDFAADETTRAKTLLFAPEAAADRPGAGAAAAAASAEPTSVSSTMRSVFRARSVATSSGTFGHLRIFTFHVASPRAFVDEFVRLLGLLPQNGLILDVRGNGGGHIQAAELTLQTLTPRRVAPEPVQFINTPLNLRLCRRHGANPTGKLDLGQWLPSLEQSLATGSAFSQGFSITSEEAANARGQVYHGPVVLITDARCYSATDIFAAGFQDHGIGPVLGVDDSTGAGGANVWEHGFLKRLFDEPTADADTPYEELPGGAGMSVSMRRTLRVGSLAGSLVEDLGVAPDIRHRMTRDDVLGGNVDLLDRAGALLAARPVRKLAVTAAPLATGDLDVGLEVENVEYVDVYVDGRPRASVDTPTGAASATIIGAAAASRVRAEAFSGGELVAARVVDL